MSLTPPRNRNERTARHGEPVATFDRIWKGWAQSIPAAERIAQHQHGRAPFLRALRASARNAPTRLVVEVGCGSAIDICLLSRALPDAYLVGIDVSQEALKAARVFAHRLGVRLQLCGGDCFALPLRDGACGLIFSQGVLEHFANPAAALAEQIRVLAPGGYLVASVPQTFTGYTLHKRRAIRRGAWPWGWEGQFTARQLGNLGRQYGLEAVEVFGYQYWRSWLEPAFVLRDLWGKVHRRNPLAHLPPFATIQRLYERVWDRLEGRYGHWFLQNLVVVFRKARANS